MEGEVRVDQTGDMAEYAPSNRVQVEQWKVSELAVRLSKLTMDNEAFTKAFDKAVDDVVKSETE